MKTTGVIRRIDDLGRIVIPKEIRKNLRVCEGDSLEILVDNNQIILNKYSIIDNMSVVAKKIVDSDAIGSIILNDSNISDFDRNIIRFISIFFIKNIEE